MRSKVRKQRTEGKRSKWIDYGGVGTTASQEESCAATPN